MATFDTPEEEWRAYLMGTHPVCDRGRRTFGRLPSGPRCKVCSAPFGAPGGLLMRRFGFTPWEKNPNLCKRCLVALATRDVSGAEVDISFLFADVRQSSDLARRLSTWEFTHLMQRFYSSATEVLFRHEALLDKFVGDEVVGFFLPFMAGPEHARRAIEAAEELMQVTGHADPGGPWLPLGAAVHTGVAFVGLVSRGETSEFTALGDPINVTAHLVAQARVGEILVSEHTATVAGLESDRRERRHLVLKGSPVDAVVIAAANGAHPAVAREPEATA
jgi:adenylate cyclase